MTRAAVANEPPEDGDTPAPFHVQCLKALQSSLRTSDGVRVMVWELDTTAVQPCLSEWARQFRQNYCPDSEIDALRAGTGKTRADYLKDMIFPDRAASPGPAIRAGDFAELLIADFLQYMEGYIVPRSKYAEKAVRNESVKGVDILGFKVARECSTSPADVLIAFEVKAQLTGRAYDGRLQDAIDHSSKDFIRRAESLNATKRRLRAAGDLTTASLVERFQNVADRPYVYRSGAAAVLDASVYDEIAIGAAQAAAHNNRDSLDLMIVRGSNLMTLVHALYSRASDEA